MGHSRPLHVVNALAPIRICDNGGWTDTWFAGHGKVFNIGVHPCVRVRLEVHAIGGLPDRIVLDAASFGDRYAFGPGALPGRHPLIEATVDDIGIPEQVSVEITISSEAPAGGSTGTSAAVTVALIGALDALAAEHLTRHQIATTAHRIEAERLGVQSGIQDQLCAAYGGINFIEMSAYPHGSVSQLVVPAAFWQELERRLVLVFLGRAHVSSDVHRRVIAGLSREGAAAPRLEALRRSAELARDAVNAGDLPALGRAMTRNTDAQQRLHDDLVGSQAQLAIDVAAENGALGWKVNGAGGEGGSVTILSGPGRDLRRKLLRALAEADPQFRIIPIRLSRHGVRVWAAT